MKVSNLLQTSDGGILLVDKGWSYQSWYNTPSLSKLDLFGNVQWNTSIAVKNIVGLTQTTDGGYVLAANGLMLHQGIGYYDYKDITLASLIKIDDKGNLMWNQTYPTRHLLSSMIPTNDGGFVLSYTTHDPESANMTWEAGLLKINSLGKLEWNNTYGQIGSINNIETTIQANDGNYVFAGSTSFNGTANSPDLYFWLGKVAENGTLIWTRYYGEGSSILNTNNNLNSGVYSGLNRGVFGDNEIYSIVEASDGGYVFLGMSYLRDNKGVTVLTKTDSSGNIVWKQIIQGAPDHPIKVFTQNSLINTSDGGFAFTGQNLTIPWILKIGAKGDILWTETFIRHYGWVSAGGNCLIETYDGDLVMAAYTDTGFHGASYYLVKVNAGLPPLSTPQPTLELSVDTSLSNQTIIAIFIGLFIIVTSVLLLIILIKNRIKYKVKA